MPVGEIIEVTVREIARILFEYLVEKLFYWPGWLILRVVTFGRYPPARDVSHNEAFVAIFGLAMFAAAVTIYFSHLR